MTNAEKYSDEQKRWALEFLRDISFDYNTLHRINLSSLEQSRDIVMELLGEQHEKITDLSNRIMQAINHIEDNCIAKNEDGTKREIAGVGDLEELEDILGGKYIYD